MQLRIDASHDVAKALFLWSGLVQQEFDFKGATARRTLRVETPLLWGGVNALRQMVRR